jgi:hypothetical protein
LIVLGSLTGAMAASLIATVPIAFIGCTGIGVR